MISTVKWPIGRRFGATKWEVTAYRRLVKFSVVRTTSKCHLIGDVYLVKVCNYVTLLINILLRPDNKERFGPRKLLVGNHSLLKDPFSLSHCLVHLNKNSELSNNQLETIRRSCRAASSEWSFLPWTSDVSMKRTEHKRKDVCFNSEYKKLNFYVHRNAVWTYPSNSMS